MNLGCSTIFKPYVFYVSKNGGLYYNLRGTEKDRQITSNLHRCFRQLHGLAEKV